MAVCLLFAASAFAESPATEEVSDKTLRTLKALAWQALPSKIVLGDNTVIEIDKSDASAIVIPDADAREIIRDARLTARAHQCNLQELVIANRDAILLREKKTGRWTESQLQYINTLHLFTVKLLLGTVETVDALPVTGLPPRVTCNEKEKRDISTAIEANERATGKS